MALHKWLQPENVYILPNCVEEERFDIRQKRGSVDAIRERIGLPLKRPILLCPGTLTAIKGQREIIQLCSRIEPILRNFLIVFIGDHGTDYGAALKDNIAESAWADHFHFESPGIYPADWFFASDLLLFPTRTEAFGRSILEAMAAQLPILSSCVGGIPELVEHLDSGYLFRDGDSDDILNGLHYMVEDGWMNARRCAENAYLRYRNHFTRTHYTTRLHQILDNF